MRLGYRCVGPAVLLAVLVAACATPQSTENPPGTDGARPWTPADLLPPQDGTGNGYESDGGAGPVVSPVSGDDTFQGLNLAGPVIKLWGDHGYQGYLLMQWADGTKIDARYGLWDSYMYCKKADTCNQMAKNNYPIQLGADWGGAKPDRIDLYNYGNCPDPVKAKVYWAGGVINGTAPLDIGWYDSKRSNGGGMTMNAIGHVVDGVRIHNLHDAHLPLEGNDFTIKNCWITHSRDDAIENDAFAAGLIEDNYIEGFHHFYSCTNTGGLKQGKTPNAYAPGGGPKAVVRIENNLIAFKKMNDERADSAGLWKDWDDRSPKIDLVDNIIYIPKNAEHKCDLKPRHPGKISGNVVIDMRGCTKPTSGFQVKSGQSGQAFWDKAVADWIANHPLVGRVEGDPDHQQWLQTRMANAGF